MEWLTTAGALGGTAVLGKGAASGAGFIQRLEDGFPGRVLAQLKKFSQLTDSDLTEVIPARTLANARKAAKLTPDQSDRVARTAGISALAQRVFGDAETAREWLLTPNPALDHELPLRMLRTGSGGDLVENVLIRIEHGVYE